MGASIAQREGHVLDHKDALAHLEQALEILDSKKTSADVGALLQEVIDRVRAIDAT